VYNLKKLADEIQFHKALATKTKSHIPALNNIWSVGQDLVVTNLEQWLILPCTLELQGPVNCMEFYEALRSCGTEGEILQGEKGITIKSALGNAHVDWAGPLTDQPKMPKPFKRETAIDISMQNLNYVFRARSSEVVRYALTGICVDGEQKAIVASDGKRLQSRPIKVDKKFKKLIVPSFAAKLALAIMKRGSNPPRISKLGVDNEDQHVSLQIGRYFIVSKVVEGHFPDWKAVTPETFSYTVGIQAKEFADALKRSISFLKTIKAKRDTVSLGIEGKDVIVVAKDPDSRDKGSRSFRARKVMHQESKEGSLAMFHGSTFNPYYLLDGMWNRAKTTIQGTNHESAILIDGQSVLMPLTVAANEKMSSHVAKYKGTVFPKLIGPEKPEAEPQVVRREVPAYEKPDRVPTPARKKAVAKSARGKRIKPRDQNVEKVVERMVQGPSGKPEHVAAPAKTRLEDINFNLFS